MLGGRSNHLNPLFDHQIDGFAGKLAVERPAIPYTPKQAAFFETAAF